MGCTESLTSRHVGKYQSLGPCWARVSRNAPAPLLPAWWSPVNTTSTSCTTAGAAATPGPRARPRAVPLCRPTHFSTHPGRGLSSSFALHQPTTPRPRRTAPHPTTPGLPHSSALPQPPLPASPRRPAPWSPLPNYGRCVSQRPRCSGGAVATLAGPAGRRVACGPPPCAVPGRLLTHPGLWPVEPRTAPHPTRTAPQQHPATQLCRGACHFNGAMPVHRSRHTVDSTGRGQS